MRRLTLALSVIALTLGFSTTPSLYAGDEAKSDKVKIAQLDLKGSPSELPVADDPIFGTLTENFQAKLDRIRQAKDDKDIKGLYLHLDGMATGWGKLNELSREIEAFRKTGKKAIAYVEAGSTMDYALALACDEICMPEAGWLMVVGLRMEVTFYKQLFEMIGAKADFLQMGDFKGAAEPYIRDSMSPALRKQLTLYLDDAYDNGLVARIAKARKLDPKKVKELIDNAPYTPKAAQKAGLIDHVVYPNQVNDLFQKHYDGAKIDIVKDYGKKKMDDLDLSNPFAILKLLSKPKPKPSKNPKIAVIYAVGVINTGKGGQSLFSGESVGSTTMVKAIQEANKDETVKAIVLRVDSPGGSALASDLIWNALKKCDKPVLASMGDVAASGGYYISMAGNKIFAEPGTLTGSIGVVGGKIALGGTFNKVGITTDILSRGKNSGVLSSETPFSESERKAMRVMMEDVYDIFLTKALEGRKGAGKEMTMNDLKKLAGGRIWTGRQALKNGLVDELGTLEDAISEAKNLAKLTAKDKTELLILPKPRSIIDQLLEDFPSLKVPTSKMNSPLLKDVTSKLGSLEGLLQLKNEPVWAVLPFRMTLR